MPAAFFVVRATVTDPAKRQAFDAWYSREHLPDAVKSFGAVKAWRYWSLTDPSLHHAMYQFSDQAALDRAMDGPHLKRLIDDFNRDWPDVTRTREVAGAGGRTWRVACALFSTNRSHKAERAVQRTFISRRRHSFPRVSQNEEGMSWNAGTF